MGAANRTSPRDTVAAPARSARPLRLGENMRSASR